MPVCISMKHITGLWDGASLHHRPYEKEIIPGCVWSMGLCLLAQALKSGKDPRWSRLPQSI